MKRNWEKCNLEDYIKLIDYRGRTPVKTQSGVRLITAKNVKLGYLQLEPQEFIDSNEYDSWMKRGVPNFGDVIFTTEAPLANVAQIDTTEKVAFAQRIIVMQPQKDKINQTFLKYLLLSNSVRKEILNKGTGATVQGIKSSLLKKIEFYLPSLYEQQRIVDILDEAFAATTIAKENADKNLENTKELFESYLQKVFTDKKFEIKALGDICEDVEYGSSTKSKKVGKIAVLRMGNIQNRKFNWEKLVYSDDIEDNKKYLLKYNDVLFNRTNSPELVGKTAIYKGEMPAIFAGYLIRIHRKENLLDADYLNYYLNSKIALDYGKTVVISSVNQANINGAKLKGYPIPCPTLKEQQVIVQKFDTLSAEVKKLEAIYQQKLDDLEELKNSILEKAINGELAEAHV